MKLHEEFKEYEELWEELSEADEALKNTPDFELEYEGFTVDSWEDVWDPYRSEPDQIDHSYRIGDFTYTVDASDMYDTICGFLERETDASKSPEVAEYLRLYTIYEKADTAEALDAVELYIVQNLDKLFETYKVEVYEHYEESAQEWAIKHEEPWEPYDPREDERRDMKLESSLNEASDPIVRTFGRKTYNLANRDELDAWFKANFEFQQKRYPNRYRNSEDSITSNWPKLRATIANNLLASLEAEGVTDQEILDYLRNIVKVGGGLGKVFRENEVSEILASMTSALTKEERQLIKAELMSIKQKLLTLRTKS